MNVCLISPPTVTEFNERQVAESEALRLIADHAPMGILSLAAVLEQHGVTPHIIDLNRLYYDYLKLCGEQRDGTSFSSYVIPYLEPRAFDIIGFSTICSTYPLTLRLAESVRSIHPGATIILGGPQASVVDVPTMKAFSYIDYIVRGEAEVTLPLLLDVLAGGGDGLARISGITYREGSEVRRNPNAAVIDDLDTLPLAAFHLYPYIYNSSYAALEAGRGCPFTCSFCSTNDFFRRRFRMKSPRVLVQQMLLIKERYGTNCFDLIHDMFTVDKKKVLSFCEALEETGQEFYWGCSARTDCLDDELISRMARAGCTGVFLGIDSGSERMQRIIDKRLNITDSLSRIKQVNRHGMSSTVSLITGFPEETKDDLRETVKFAGESLRYQDSELQLHLLAPLAETPLTTEYKEQLVYDEIFSDMSFQGWEQDPEDRAMIVAHRDIFPNFYAIQTRWLDRYYLKELREFLLKGVRKHQWLMLLLHRDSGDLLRVFDDWKCWQAEGENPTAPSERTRSYYLSRSFSEDLLRFVRSHYLVTLARNPSLVATLVDVESALLSLNEGKSPVCERPSLRSRRKPTAVGVDAVPTIAGNITVVSVDADYRRLMRCLKRQERLDRLPAEPVILAFLKLGDRIKILQLNHACYRLLSLCNGARSIMEIADSFSNAEESDGISMMKAGLYVLATFAREGLIELRETLA